MKTPREIEQTRQLFVRFLSDEAALSEAVGRGRSAGGLIKGCHLAASILAWVLDLDLQAAESVSEMLNLMRRTLERTPPKGPVQ